LVDLLIATRAVHFAATALTAGAIFFALYALPAACVFRTEVLRLARIALVASMISGAIWVLLQAAAMSGAPLGGIFAGGILWAVLTETHFGIVNDVRLAVALSLGALLILATTTRASLWGAAALAAVLLATIAWNGHAAGTPPPLGIIHLSADALHVLAAGAWIGGLLPLGLLLFRAHTSPDAARSQLARMATLRFSVIGVISVGVLLATGILNTSILAGSLPALIGTTYGVLLVVKITLFACMVAFATVNRLRLTPQLADRDAEPRGAAMRQLARNASVEFALGLAIFGVVGMLGTLPPALHTQPIWPLTFRLTPGALFEKAYPTSFYMSPTGYSVDSIAQGSMLFSQYCTTCHGERGRGDGPMASQSTRKPADLAAAHIYAHTDGDLFWWISHGIEGAMPAFGDAIDETGRWNLIDFIRANADGLQLQNAQSRISSVGYPVPIFSTVCGETDLTIDGLRGKTIHVVFAPGQSPESLQRLEQRDLALSVKTIVATSDASAAASADTCTTDDPSLLPAMAIYRGSEPGNNGRSEWLVDPAGLLRAIWSAEADAGGWDDDARFHEAIHQLQTQAAAPLRLAAHAHH
jgi:putative copper resistance protein D